MQNLNDLMDLLCDMKDENNMNNLQLKEAIKIAMKVREDIEKLQRKESQLEQIKNLLK